ncbi:hypothetical protein [Roseateles noduli]|uniref:hypothetical protein n=1 Tax=Roseateles noduli TaxID=2052484 RepID=UPI003D65FF13
MKVIAYALRRDGSAFPAAGETDMRRPTMDGSKKAYGGEPVPGGGGCRLPPDAYSMWRTRPGQVFAINPSDSHEHGANSR